MEGICLNLLEATVTLYPANADGTPQLNAGIWCGVEAENLRGMERWLKKETQPSGARYPRRHPFVPEYEVSIGRLWILQDTAPAGWQTSYKQYVLDITWVEEETQQWHRKTFYGVTISERSWDAHDVESGIVENQVFEAQYMVTAGGQLATGVPPVPATLPLYVIYTGSNGNSVLLYNYDATAKTFTAMSDTTGRATIVNAPFAVQFAEDGSPAVYVNSGTPINYRNNGQYRNANGYRKVMLNAVGIFAQPAAKTALPRLDFYYGETRVFTVTRDGVFEADYIEAPAPAPAAGTFAANSDAGVFAVFARNNLTAACIKVSP